MKRALAYLILGASIAFAHPGGLDKNGGHVDRKTGKYHSHRSPSAPSQSSQSSDKPTANHDQAKPRGTVTFSNEAKEKRLGEYFRNANAGLASTPIGVIYERKVTEATKRKVIARSGGCCVVCLSTLKLEVDHKIALMNGGTNDENNLATLCDECHLAKTKMDNSLRRQRQKHR